MTSNQTFKPSEGKREEFRKYLEKNGIMDALTKVLVKLYEEVDKPEEPLQYMIDKLTTEVGWETHAQLLAKLDEAAGKIKALEDEADQFRLKQVDQEGVVTPEEETKVEAPEKEADVKKEADQENGEPAEPPADVE